MRSATCCLAIATIASCTPSDKTPEGTVRALIAASATGDAARIYALLAPRTRTALKKMAELASAQTGGRQRLRPEELLAASIDPPRHAAARMETELQGENKATVTLVSTKDAQETLRLERIKGLWRVVLPLEKAATDSDKADGA